MTINVTGMIRRVMDWCPKNDFMGHRTTEKHEHYFSTSYENGSNKGEPIKILTDYQFNKVIYAGCTAFFIFLIVGLAFPNLHFLAVIPVLSLILTSVILFLQDRTALEFLPNAIIIKRLLLKPVEISRKNILNIEVAKNPNNRFRWAMISFVIIAFIYWSMNAIDTLTRSMARDPFPFFILIAFQQSTLLILVTVLFYKWYIRSCYENFLKITSRNKGEIAIYVDDPEGLARKLGLK